MEPHIRRAPTCPDHTYKSTIHVFATCGLQTQANGPHFCRVALCWIDVCMLHVPIPLPEAYLQHLNHASSRGAKAKQSSCSFWLHPSRTINWLTSRGYRYSYLLVRMREQRCWYLCCTVTRPLGSRTWPRKSAETTGRRFRSKSYPFFWQSGRRRCIL